MVSCLLAPPVAPPKAIKTQQEAFMSSLILPLIYNERVEGYDLIQKHIRLGTFLNCHKQQHLSVF